VNFVDVLIISYTSLYGTFRFLDKLVGHRDSILFRRMYLEILIILGFLTLHFTQLFHLELPVLFLSFEDTSYTL
jgi:hypothetical protein